MKSFVVAIIVIFSLVSAIGAAVVVEDATSIAPTPSMQSAGATLQVSGLVAVIASLAACLF